MAFIIVEYSQHKIYAGASPDDELLQTHQSKPSVFSSNIYTNLPYEKIFKTNFI